MQQAREEKDLSLQAVSNKLFIRVHYLEAIENGQFDQITSRPQLIGFIRAYSDFLELDTEDLIMPFKKTDGEEELIPKVESEDQEIDTTNVFKAKNIFIEIGRNLIDSRDKLGLSLDDVASITHIHQHQLEAIELGDINHFASAAQARGMLKNYTDFLGLDTERMLIRFAEALQSRIGVQPVEIEELEVEPEDPNKFERPTFSLREIISLDMIVFGVVGILIIVFLFWGVGRVLRLQSEQGPNMTQTEEVVAESTENPNQFADTDDPTGDEERDDEIQPTEESKLTSTPTIQVIPGGSINLNIYINYKTYLQIIVDGQEKFNGRPVEGSTHSYSGQNAVEVNTGNGAAIEITLNGVLLGTLGDVGNAVHLIYTDEGVITPTPVPTPTNIPEITN